MIRSDWKRRLIWASSCDNHFVRAVILLVCATCAIACGGAVTASEASDGGSTRETDTDASAEVSQLQACPGLSTFDHGDGGSACGAARAFFGCPGEACISNDLGCPGQADPTQCHDQCGPDQYAVECRAAVGLLPDGGPPPSPQPPSACVLVTTAVEIVFFCCPCG